MVSHSGAAKQHDVTASGRLDCVLMRIVHLKGPLHLTSMQAFSNKHDHVSRAPYPSTLLSGVKGLLATGQPASVG